MIMSNVIEFPSTDDKRGYVMEGDKIIGVYTRFISAMDCGDFAYIGKKTGDGIDPAITVDVEEINDFCVMWLAIFAPEVLTKE